MRRLARRLLTLCSAVSLLLCVAMCVLWAWDGRSTGGRASLAVRGERYTLASEAGRLTLNRLPRYAGDPKRRALLSDLTAAMGDGGLRWTVLAQDGLVYAITPGFASRSPADLLSRYLDSADVERPLLDALGDENRFVMAHKLLVQRNRRRPGRFSAH